MSEQITVLAIETSCDETGVAVVRKTDQKVEILADIVASQVNIHALTGGVIPEVAAREHVLVIRPLIEKVLEKANITKKDLNAIAVTVTPGLQPALSVGVTAARALSVAWDKPLVPVHHLEGHIYSALLQGEVVFPVLALIVSGGHTMLISMKNHLQYEILGSTIDDAAGEAFDKVARLLDLPYPGGPEISKIAEKGNPEAVAFPRPMTHSDDLRFSFSGLKTAVLYEWRGIPEEEKAAKKADIAASFQEAVVDTLAQKTKSALAKDAYKVLVVAGGVAANKALQERMKKLSSEMGIELRIPPVELYGDNAAMIGQVGVWAFERAREISWKTIDAIARTPIDAFSNNTTVR